MIKTKNRRVHYIPSIKVAGGISGGGSAAQISDFVDAWYDIGWAAANNQLWTTSGKTVNATAESDAVHVIGPRVGSVDLVWQGGGGNEPTLPAGLDYVQHGGTLNYHYQVASAFTAVTQPYENIYIHTNVAGDNFGQLQGASGSMPVLQDNNANVRIVNGATATFTNGSPADGTKLVSRLVLNGASSQYWEGATQIGGDQDGGSNTQTRDGIGNAASGSSLVNTYAYMRVNSGLSAGDWTTLIGLINTEYGL